MNICEDLLIIITLFVLKFKTVVGNITDKEYFLMPTLFHFDNYDNCMLLGEEALYCTVTLQLYPQNPKNTTKIWDIIQRVSLNKYNYRHDILRHKLCVPELLNLSFIKNELEIRRNLENLYQERYTHIHVLTKVTDLKCEFKESSYKIDFYDILFGTFVMFYVLFVLVASVYEGIAEYKNREKYKDTLIRKLITPFSLSRNWCRLKRVNWNDPDVQNLRCIQGVRFYNMIIVIIGHTIASNLAAPVSNPQTVESMKDQFVHVFLGMGKYIIQTYFMISTWLLTYYFFLVLEKKEKIKPLHVILIIIHRYIRLTPALAIMVGLHSTLTVHLLRGPIWDQLAGEDYRLCRESWWTNLLYINNYVNRNRMCLPQTWYMAVDTQYYVICIFLLLLMWNYKKKIFYILSSILIYHIGSLFYIYYWYNLDSTGLVQPEILYNRRLLKTDLWHMTSTSISSNLAGLVAGLSYGYLYYNCRHKQLFTKKIHTVTWWILIWTSSLGTSLLPAFISIRSELLLAIYNSISRSLFIFGIGLGIFGMTQGLGWMIKWVCEWSPTYILGRLTYSAYLVHIFFQRFQEGTKRYPTYVAGHVICMESIGNVAVSYMGALILTLFVEMPVSELQKRLLPKNRKRQTNLKQKSHDEKIT